MGERITRSEAAAVAGVAPDTFSAYVNRGHAPRAVAHVGRTGLWDADEVRAWQDSRPGQGGWSASRARNRAAADVSEQCEQAIRAAAASFDVEVDAVRGGGRARPVANARIVAMASAYCAGATPHQIAATFGRDHSTVSHAVRRARNDACLAGAVEDILSIAFAGRKLRDL